MVGSGRPDAAVIFGQPLISKAFYAGIGAKVYPACFGPVANHNFAKAAEGLGISRDSDDNMAPSLVYGRLPKRDGGAKIHSTRFL